MLGVDVDADEADLVVAAPFDDRMEEARADGERDVYRRPEIIADLHRRGQRMADVDRAGAMLAHDNRRLKHFGQLQQLGLGAEHATADENRRVPGLAEKPRGAFDFVRVGFWLRQRHADRVVRGGPARRGDIRRDLDHDRPPAAAGHLPERFRHDLRGFGHGVDPPLPFGDRCQRPLLMRDLVQEAEPAFDVGRGYLPGDAKHRAVAGVGGGEGRGRIEDARPRNHQACADPAARLRVAERHVGRRLLMARVDDVDRRATRVERVEDVIELQPGQAEYRQGAVRLERADQSLGAGRLCFRGQGFCLRVQHCQAASPRFAIGLSGGGFSIPNEMSPKQYVFF